MRKTHGLIAMVVLVGALAVPAAAAAQEGGGGSAMGVGATRTLAGINAATFVYDNSSFHIVGLVGLLDIDANVGDNTTAFALGGQFHYHVHSTSQSDFSLGGGLTIVSFDDGNGTMNVDLEGLAQIRIFVVPNVALSASIGLLLALGDDETIFGNDLVIFGRDNNADSAIAFGGQVTAAMGVTYFFR